MAGNRAAWNPLGGRLDLNRARQLGTQRPTARTGIEESQGSPYPLDIESDLLVPQDYGINTRGYLNPYASTMYTQPVPNGAAAAVSASIVAPANNKRVYFVIQNQGPGNVWICPGTYATVATVASNSNGLQLIQTQLYEQVGGGYYDELEQRSKPFCFVAGDYWTAIADQDQTTVLIYEGVWRPSGQTGYTGT
jgi:hypothetical protein